MSRPRRRPIPAAAFAAAFAFTYLAATVVLFAAPPAEKAAPAKTGPAAAAAPVAEKPPEAPMLDDPAVSGPAGPTLPGLPVALRFSWRNTLAQAARVPDWWAVRLTVEKVGDPSPPRELLARAASPAAVSMLLEPARTCTRTMLLAVGRGDGDPKSPPEFLFPEPGRYVVRGRGLGDAAFDVSVEEPATPEDKAGRAVWTPELAAALTCDARPAKELPAAAERLCASLPGGRYGGWGLWAGAAYVSRFSADRREQDDAAHACEVILDRHPSLPLREEALDTLVRLCRATFQGPRARAAAEELARALPDSLYAARLKKVYGDDFSKLSTEPTPVAAASPVQVAVVFSGLDAVPEGPRRVFEAYLQAVGKGRFDAAAGMLARDFMGDEGPPSRQAERWMRERRAASGGEVRVAVRKATMVNAYTRPLSLPSGHERTWHGPICFIEGAVVTRLTPASGGKESTVDAPFSSWALYAYPGGQWKLVSEGCATRHFAAANAAHRLIRDLPSTFTTWRISDGTRQRFPYEEVKQQAGVAGKVDDARTEWQNHTILMVGDRGDQVVMTGKVRMLLRLEGAAAKVEQWVERPVRLEFGLGDGDSLILKSVEVWLQEPPANKIVPAEPSPKPARAK